MKKKFWNILEFNPASYPKNIKGLTSLRFAAVLYVILFHYHFKFHPSIDLIISKGYLAVDFFFILSGFILTHCYKQSIQDGTFSYRSFMIRRIARIYPVHLFTLSVMCAIFALYQLAGNQLTKNTPTISDFIQNIFLVHSWGLASDLSFNRYSWTISAEFLAYILFPALFIIMNRIKPIIISILLASLIYALLWVFSPSLWSLPLSQLAIFGLPRIFPEFLLGITLYMFGQKYRLTKHGNATLLVCALVLVSALLIKCGDWIAVPVFAVLILAVAEQSRSERQNFLFDNSTVYLGEISYSLYMIQFPYMFLVFDTLLGWGLETQENTKLWSTFWSISPIVILILAMITHKYIENPARRWTIKLLSPKEN